MIKVLCIFSILVAYNSYAASPDLTTVLNPSSTSLNIDSVDKYEAKVNTSYKGRNLNIQHSNSITKFQNSNGVSRNIVQANSNGSMDNLESTAGEFIQKLEEDRIKKSKDHANKYKDTRNILINAYTESKKINTNNLGAEQDPYVQRAFKCSNLNNCNPSNENDKHAVKKCTKSERLHWTGSQWKCINLFQSGGSLECDSSKQWTKKVNNGTACIDYIYQWVKVGVEGCKSNNKAKNIYKCKRKKTPNDAGVDVAGSYCKSDEPVSYSSCQYSGPWTVGSWSGCSTSCGGGRQTRSVSCKYVVCTGGKPSTIRSCNTHKCISYSWRVSCSYTHCGANCSGSASVCCNKSVTERCLASNGSNSWYVSNSYCKGRAPSCTPTNNPRRNSGGHSCPANGCGRGNASGRVN